ncbi:MAG: MoxR family ATPase [Gammaproteobacteria bacterium]|nr:MoxR family ATPase [Gammaproteobacteria bacterium]
MHPTVERIATAIGTIILGKDAQIRLALACLLARGHLLIEDVPGVGKTSLAHVLAKVLGLHFQRIQFTSDLLPADILGVAVFERETGQFKFHPGPIFSQVVLADEVNRATPKTQSALLEAMEETQVTVEGETRLLPRPFFVIATQNPVHQIGTFPLPESQLDRFLVRIQLGYPDSDAERELLRGDDRRRMIKEIGAVIDASELTALQDAVDQVHVSEALLDYAQALIQFSRQSAKFPLGLSPRAGLALLQCARAWALIDGRDIVLPEDVQAVLPGVVTHRLRNGEDGIGNNPAQVLIESVPLP